MSQSPAISAALDRVNSTGSEISQLNLYSSSEPRSAVDRDFSKPRRPPHRPTRLQSLDTSNQSSAVIPTEPNSPATSQLSSPGIQSGSEIAPSEPMDGKSSVGQPSPPLHRPIVMWTKPPANALDRRAAVAKSLPTLPPTPEIEPSRRRSNSESDSVRLPSPAVWDDNVSVKAKPELYKALPQISPEAQKMLKHASTISQQDSFERQIFKNSAQYCNL
jgi:hypothetical protein